MHANKNNQLVIELAPNYKIGLVLVIIFLTTIFGLLFYLSLKEHNIFLLVLLPLGYFYIAKLMQIPIMAKITLDKNTKTLILKRSIGKDVIRIQDIDEYGIRIIRNRSYSRPGVNSRILEIHLANGSKYFYPLFFELSDTNLSKIFTEFIGKKCKQYSTWPSKNYKEKPNYNFFGL